MKKVIGMVAAVAFAAVAGVNVYEAQVTETAMSDLQMENVEALAAIPEIWNPYWWRPVYVEYVNDCMWVGGNCLSEVVVKP